MSTSDLERAIDSLGNWLVFWTIIVALGLVVEYTKDVKDFLVAGFKWLFCSGTRPTLTVTIVGALLITSGVIGEGLIEFRASNAETLLREANDGAFTNLGTLAANAKKSSDDAADDASRANASAQRANKEALIAKARAEDVEKQADELSEKTSELAKNLADAQNAELAERKKVLELENSLAPRELFIERYADRTSNIDELKQFGATQALVQYIPDFEAERAARFLASALEMSNWKISGVEPTKEYVFDGVQVERYQPPSLEDPITHPETFPLVAALDMSQRACDAIINFLSDSNWRSKPRVAFGIPPGSVRIRVGFKPNPYFLPKPFRDSEKEFEDIRNRLRPNKRTTAPIVSILEAMPWIPPPSLSSRKP
jgi:hypothetical protein